MPVFAFILVIYISFLRRSLYIRICVGIHAAMDIFFNKKNSGQDFLPASHSNANRATYRNGATQTPRRAIYRNGFSVPVTFSPSTEPAEMISRFQSPLLSTTHWPSARG